MDRTNNTTTTKYPSTEKKGGYLLTSSAANNNIFGSVAECLIPNCTGGYATNDIIEKEETNINNPTTAGTTTYAVIPGEVDGIKLKDDKDPSKEDEQVPANKLG